MTTENSQIAFHIGPWKTGSTYLQQYVFSRLTNVEVLRNPSLHVLLRRCVAGGRILVTSEDLSGVPYGKDYALRRKKMVETLGASFPGSALIVVLRDPATMIPSLYFQYVKRGGSRPFDEFFHEKLDVDAFRPEALLNAVEHSGFSKVSVFFFEDLFGDKGQEDEILKVFDDWEYRPVAVIRGRGANVSLKRNGARLLRGINYIAFRLGMGDRDRMPLLNGYRLRRLRLAPASLLTSWAFRWIDRTGSNLATEAWPEALDELSCEYSTLKDHHQKTIV